MEATYEQMPLGIDEALVERMWNAESLLDDWQSLSQMASISEERRRSYVNDLYAGMRMIRALGMEPTWTAQGYRIRLMTDEELREEGL